LLAALRLCVGVAVAELSGRSGTGYAQEGARDAPGLLGANGMRLSGGVLLGLGACLRLAEGEGLVAVCHGVGVVGVVEDHHLETLHALVQFLGCLLKHKVFDGDLVDFATHEEERKASDHVIGATRDTQKHTRVGHRLDRVRLALLAEVELLAVLSANEDAAQGFTLLVGPQPDLANAVGGGVPFETFVLLLLDDLADGAAVAAVRVVELDGLDLFFGGPDFDAAHEDTLLELGVAEFSARLGTNVLRFLPRATGAASLRGGSSAIPRGRGSSAVLGGNETREEERGGSHDERLGIEDHGCWSELPGVQMKGKLRIAVE
jgi:hypothetical protein